MYAGYWEFPGGKCEPGELPAQAVARECLEETGLHVEVGRLRTARFTVIHTAWSSSIFMIARPLDRTAEPSAASGFRWVTCRRPAPLRFPEANEAVVSELARRATGA